MIVTQKSALRILEKIKAELITKATKSLSYEKGARPDERGVKADRPFAGPEIGVAYDIFAMNADEMLLTIEVLEDLVKAQKNPILRNIEGGL